MWPTGHQLNRANAHLQTVDHFWQTTIDFTFTCMSVVTVKRLSGKAKQGTKMMHFFVRIAAQWLTWPELVWIALITHHGSSDSSSNITLQTSQINHIQSGFIFFEGTLYKTVKCVDAQTFGEGDERTLDIHSYRQESLCSFFLKFWIYTRRKSSEGWGSGEHQYRHWGGVTALWPLCRCHIEEPSWHVWGVSGGKKHLLPEKNIFNIYRLAFLSWPWGNNFVLLLTDHACHTP